MLPPQQFRIVSDTVSQSEAFIPIDRSPRSLAILRELLDPSPEAVERRRVESEAHAAEVEAKRVAEEAAHRARHATLLTEHADSPILTALLHAHAPVGQGPWLVCVGCPPYSDHHDEEQAHEWPCPTWSLIEQGA